MSNDHNDPHSSRSSLPQDDSRQVNATGHLSDSTPSPVSVIPDSLGHEVSTNGLAAIQFSTASASLHGTSSMAGAALEFRVIRPGLPVRRLRLTGNRYTFGSGEGCSIRLDDETLRPMHAVLLRDAHRILMRAYSVPLECNGTRVTESVLRLGDIIRMGNYRFELLAAPGYSDATVQSSAGAARASMSTRVGQSGETSESQLRDRLNQLSQQWHARHAECEVRESRCDQRETELHGRETELWGRAENLQHRESLLLAQEAAAREIQETYAATQEELRSLRRRENEANEALQQKEAELLEKSKQLQERQAEMERRQIEWQEREEQYAERAAQAQKKLEQTQQQAQAASDAVGRMREEFATLNEQLTELRERHSELQVREKQEQEEHERLRAELESSRNAAVEAHAQSESERAKVEDKLRRVTADLESTRSALAQIREESKAYQNELNEKLRATGQELQTTREEAERARRASEEDHAYTEKRIIELEERLAVVQENRENAESAAQEEIAGLKRQYETAESGRKGAEQIAEELRASIRELQESVAEANQEASQLRSEQEGANASIRQLELLVDQTKNNQSAQQESWIQESDQLRQTIEDLSVQLANASAELSQLRSTNEALSSELAETQTEADTLRSSAIDAEQFRVLEQELDSARQEIGRLQVTHAETVSRLENERKESESALRDEIEKLRDEIASAQQAAEASIKQFAESNRAFTENLADIGTLDDAHEEKPIETVSPSTNEIDEYDVTFATEKDDDLELHTDSVADPVSGLSHGADLSVKSDANIWRMEPEQAVEQGTHLEDWDTAHGSPSGDAESDWSTSSWSQSELLGDAETEDDSDLTNELDSQTSDEIERSGTGISWHDEPPEQSVSDAIDDIEHNVEQAIADYDTPADPVWPDADNDSESSAWGSAPDLSEFTSPDEPEQMSGQETVEEVDEPDHVTENSNDPSFVGELEDHANDDAEDFVTQDDVDADPGLYTGFDQGENQDPPGNVSNQGMSDTEIVRRFANRIDADDDTPLNWSSYMPGGDSLQTDATDSETTDSDATMDDDYDESPSSSWSDSDWSHSSSRDEATDTDDEVAAHEDSLDAHEFDATQQWSRLTDDTAAVDHYDDADEYQNTDQPVGDASISEGAYLDSSPGEEDEPLIEAPVGSLAEMLIRDLSMDRDDYSSHDDVPEANDEVESTFLMGGDIKFADEDEETDNESSSWNFESPAIAEEESVGLGNQEDFDSDDDQSDDVSQTAVAPSRDTVVVESEPEDDSIEAYMSRLLQRVQGDEAAPPAASKQAAPKPEPKRDTVKLTDSGPTRDAEQSAPVTPSIHDSTPLVPRSQAPELSRNLSAMRELANQSARNAVARSIRIQARDTQMKAVVKGGLTIGFVMMAIGVFLFVSWSLTIKLAMIGAFIVLAGVFGQEAYILMRDARRRLALAQSDNERDEAEIAAEMQRIADETEMTANETEA
ncbi:MAG: hypothetical protein KDB00_04235 [Planctomycetales bacterium]|nr:hypothetical protein [Planctomycetales bacterium]